MLLLKKCAANEQINVAAKPRNQLIDALKGVAIVAVVLYHFAGDIFLNGYLGVDVFFVISGYFFIKSLLKQYRDDNFNYSDYFFRKIIRLWPLIIIIATISMAVGYFVMLPDDYENLAQSSIASIFFSNNILQCITTKNYWNISNLYKPLMHLWYVGVLMQAFVFFPLIVNLLKKKTDGIKALKISTIGVTIVSLALFAMPFISDSQKFYYLPFRFFEVTIAGFVVLFEPKIPKGVKTLMTIASIVGIILLLGVPQTIIPKNVMLLLTVVFSLLFLASNENQQYNDKTNCIFALGAYVGKRSYSIYIWHQAIVAFMFYAFFENRSALAWFIFVFLTILVSILSFCYIERTLENLAKEANERKKKMLLSVIVSIMLCCFSFVVYSNAGVVRDVPELATFRNAAHRGMHAEYCDRPYGWNEPFVNNKINVVVVGNSFGRDFANILYEWDEAKKLHISYVYSASASIWSNIKKIKEADFVFYAIGPSLEDVPEVLKDSVSFEKLYVVGSKNFGKSNGIVYAHRNSVNYFKQTVRIENKFKQNNKKNQLIFGNHFINMIDPVLEQKYYVRVFTDDNKFISQDCNHLTQAGAIYYGKLLKLNEIFYRTIIDCSETTDSLAQKCEKY